MYRIFIIFFAIAACGREPEQCEDHEIRCTEQWDVMEHCWDGRWIPIDEGGFKFCTPDDPPYTYACDYECNDGDTLRYFDQDWICKPGPDCDQPYFQEIK